MATAKTNSIFVEDFISFSIRIFNTLGLKMTNTPISPKKWNKALGSVSAVFTIVMLFQISVFNLVNLGAPGMFLKFLFNLSAIFFVALVILKVFIICVVKRDDIAEVIATLDSLFPKAKQEHDVQKYFFALKLQKRIYIFGLLLQFVLISFEILTTFLKLGFDSGNFDRQYVFDLWFPFGSDGKASVIFGIFHPITSYCIFSINSISLAIELLFFGLVSLLCTEFEILRKKFEDFDEKRTNKDLTDLVEIHCQLIR